MVTIFNIFKVTPEEVNKTIQPCQYAFSLWLLIIMFVCHNVVGIFAVTIVSIKKTFSTT